LQNNDTEVSTASIVVGAPTGGEVTGSSVALNRVSWTQSGLHVTVGDDMGKLWVIVIHSRIEGKKNIF